MDREGRARARRPGEAGSLSMSWKMTPVIKAVKGSLKRGKEGPT
jgi:hypothetical protein